MKSNECKYQGNERKLKEQFINNMNDKAMTSEIIKELAAMRDTSEVTNKKVLVWA